MLKYTNLKTASSDTLGLFFLPTTSGFFLYFLVQLLAAWVWFSPFQLQTEKHGTLCFKGIIEKNYSQNLSCFWDELKKFWWTKSFIFFKICEIWFFKSNRYYINIIFLIKIFIESRTFKELFFFSCWERLFMLLNPTQTKILFHRVERK